MKRFTGSADMGTVQSCLSVNVSCLDEVNRYVV